MLMVKTPIDAEAVRMRLDEVGSAIQREAERAEPDPFDDALLNGVFGLLELSKSQSKMIAQVQKRLNKLARGL